MGYDRKDVVDILNSWLGAKKGSTIHHQIIDLYNEIKGVTHMTYNAAWCAATISAAFHKAGMDAIFPSECSCGRMINKAKQMGIWVEDDAYVPKMADCVIYDWDDGKNYATTDDTTGHDHIGAVSVVSGKAFNVIEGNKGTPGTVAIRSMNVNGRYIRGFICPKFESKVVKVDKYPTLKLGSKGQYVMLLHEKLRAFGYGVSPSNDKFDKITEDCVLHFQLTHELVPDKIVGPKTWSALG